MSNPAATNTVEDLPERVRELERAAARQDRATRRLQVASGVSGVGGALLALTAAPWLVRTREIDETGIRTVDEHIGLWTMLGTINDSYLGPAVIAVVLVAGFGLLCLAWPLLGSRSAGPLASYGWIAAGITGLIMLNADAGFRPTVGAWATLVTCAVVALVASTVAVVRSVRHRG